jgi:hypothetical protein
MSKSLLLDSKEVVVDKSMLATRLFLSLNAIERCFLTVSVQNFISHIALVKMRIRLKQNKDDDHDHEHHTSTEYNCRLCGEHFDSFGDMQRHELVKHVQANFDKDRSK